MVTDKSVDSKTTKKPFTYAPEGEGVISNRLYIKLRILRWSRTSIFFVSDVLDKDNRWAVPEYCRSKGYQR